MNQFEMHTRANIYYRSKFEKQFQSITLSGLRCSKKKKKKFDGTLTRVSSVNVRWLKETMEIVGAVVRPQIGTAFVGREGCCSC